MLRVYGKPGLNQHKQAVLHLGHHITLHTGVHFYLDSPTAHVEVGDCTAINRRTEVCCQQHVQIGEGCMIGWDVLIMDTDYHQIEGQPTGTGPILEVGDKISADQARRLTECWNATGECNPPLVLPDGAMFSAASRPVTIGDHVWIGARATILKGVTIGNGAVIAAGATVTHDVPAETLAVGSPAVPTRTGIQWR
jgi:acetyltransferase-like isoleucine patch superfamily enzyme